MKKTYHLLVCLILGFAPLTEGKPLSYAGGTMVMQENNETDPHFALGLYPKYRINQLDEFCLARPQLNMLSK